MNLNHPLTIRRVTAIETAIRGRALDYKEIAVRSHTGEAYTLKCMKALRDLGRVHVEAWRLHGRMYGAVYRFGAGVDAPRPVPTTTKEWQRAYRARIRKDPVANALFLARMRAKDRAARAAKRPQTWMSALMPQQKGGPRARVQAEGPTC